MPERRPPHPGLATVASALAAWSLAVACHCRAQDIVRAPLDDAGAASLVVPADGRLHFLAFGAHSYAPASFVDENGQPISPAAGAPVTLALFQQLCALQLEFPRASQHDHPRGAWPARDAFWDQLLLVRRADQATPPAYRLVESGSFAAALPELLRPRPFTADQIAAQEASLVDPVIPADLAVEMPWRTLAAAAYPLDFQKVLLAVPHDANPAFAYQNGQWFTTWPWPDGPPYAKEDRWFAPALALGDVLVRPAPLSARTGFVRTADGRLLPQWELRWRHETTVVRQTMVAHRPAEATGSAVYVRFQIAGAPAGARLALGTGRRPNAHYWDDASRERTPIPFFTQPSSCRRDARRVVDAAGRTVLVAGRDFALAPAGPFEDLLLFEPDASGAVELCSPQGETAAAAAAPADWQPSFAAAEADFQRIWRRRLARGARATLPSAEWTDRIDAWQTQVDAITRVRYQGRDRLSYGAYFYQYYFGIEESWPVLALGQWGRGAEARRQAEIMLEPENLDKSNIHHQSRNGAAPWTAAVVSRLLDDPQWLARVAPPMIACAEWTSRVRAQAGADRSPLTRGLLPAHIYGGDVRDPATSLYATAICWKGMHETAEVLVALGDESLRARGAALRTEADDLRRTLFAALHAVAVDDRGQAFVPLALELPSLDGRHEGPYQALTASRLGNYWNLFAPSLLQLQLCGSDPAAFPAAEVLDYMGRRGGLWASLPRFYYALDAAYAGGIVDQLLHASAVDVRRRPRALAALEAYFLHAASRNGYTIPEVAGLFPRRLDARAYEQLVREAPWSFGMYDADRYLAGDISFTEPLGAGAGQALSLIRDALLLETLGPAGLPDGGLVVLPTVPSDWFAQGRTIELRDFPTAYGALSVRVESQLDARGEITVTYRFRPHRRQPPPAAGLRFRVRIVPPGRPPVDLPFPAESTGAITYQSPALPPALPHRP